MTCPKTRWSSGEDDVGGNYFGLAGLGLVKEWKIFAGYVLRRVGMRNLVLLWCLWWNTE
jgi:hypothetical protein